VIPKIEVETKHLPTLLLSEARTETIETRFPSTAANLAKPTTKRAFLCFKAASRESYSCPGHRKLSVATVSREMRSTEFSGTIFEPDASPGMGLSLVTAYFPGSSEYQRTLTEQE